MTPVTLITATANDVWICATYSGGPYIEMSFSAHAGSYPAGATEVINVWDDEHRRPLIKATLAGVAIRLQAWMDTQDEEWPDEWDLAYLRNALEGSR